MMRMEAFISFYLNQAGASTMLTYVGRYPCDDSCKMRGSCHKDVQNDVPHCSSQLHKTDASNPCQKWHMPGIRSELQKNSFSKLVFI